MYTQPRLRLYPEERKDNAANAANAENSRRTRDRPGRARLLHEQASFRTGFLLWFGWARGGDTTGLFFDSYTNGKKRE
jgi:hypothetical protein